MYLYLFSLFIAITPFRIFQWQTAMSYAPITANLFDHWMSLLDK